MALHLTSCERLKSDPRPLHEIHNDIALACSAVVIAKFAALEDRLIALERIVAGVVGFCGLQPEGNRIALDIIRDCAGDRLGCPSYGDPAP